jgi:hypothetical protein
MHQHSGPSYYFHTDKFPRSAASVHWTRRVYLGVAHACTAVVTFVSLGEETNCLCWCSR